MHRFYLSTQQLALVLCLLFCWISLGLIRAPRDENTTSALVCMHRSLDYELHSYKFGSEMSSKPINIISRSQESKMGSGGHATHLGNKTRRILNLVFQCFSLSLNYVSKMRVQTTS
jgi:hypothetical protein